jgi:N-acetylmuramic acid 6-phosphate (MurNAc-6-P) etherase
MMKDFVTGYIVTPEVTPGSAKMFAGGVEKAIL